jgi:hypothetical protein
VNASEEVRERGWHSIAGLEVWGSPRFNALTAPELNAANSLENSRRLQFRPDMIGVPETTISQALVRDSLRNRENGYSKREWIFEKRMDIPKRRVRVSDVPPAKLSKVLAFCRVGIPTRQTPIARNRRGIEGSGLEVV